MDLVSYHVDENDDLAVKENHDGKTTSWCMTFIPRHVNDKWIL
jgi:hypothetical protein